MKSDIERRRQRRAVNTLGHAIDQRERFSGLSMIATRKFLTSRQCLTALFLISSLVLASATARAETVTVTGADGVPANPNGGDAVANAGPGPGPDPTNTANAFGGTGGPDFVGNGGNATSTATTSIASGAARANNNATRGAGGFPGFREPRGRRRHATPNPRDPQAR